MAQYHTQENEIKKGVSRIPLPMARLTEGDLIQINSILEKSMEIHVLDETAIYERKRLKEMCQELEAQIDHRNSVLGKETCPNSANNRSMMSQLEV